MKSNRQTFDLWLEKCGGDLSDFDGVLSFSGSDGPKITDTKVGKAHFSNPEEVENFLIEYGAYQKQKVMFDVEYNPPTIHYLDWLKNGSNR